MVSSKYKNRTNAYNSSEGDSECGVSKDNSINQYDEETVLLQIPLDDTKIGDIVDIMIGRCTDQTKALRKLGKAPEAQHLYTMLAYNALKEFHFLKKPLVFGHFDLLHSLGSSN